MTKNQHRCLEMTMRRHKEPQLRRIRRIVLLTGLLALTPVLSGCESFDMDKLDVFGLTEKKKLPGERKPVFPEGVPGVTQGIPPEYIKGNQPAAEAVEVIPSEPERAAAVAPAPAPAPAPRAKAPPRQPRPATAAAPARSAPPTAQPQQQPAAWPEPAQPAPQQAQQPWPSPAQSSSTAPWPSAPPPGSFSR